MTIAFILYDNLTLLDLVGFYDPVTRLRTMDFLPGLSWDFCAMQPEVKDNFGFRLQAGRIQPDLSAYDLIFIPGGFGTRELVRQRTFIDWLKTAAPAPRKLSVCTGSLLLGAAGFLANRRATTHYDEYEALKPYCQEVVREELVEDEGVITAGAVSSSILLGLYLAERLAGIEARIAIQRRMNFTPPHGYFSMVVRG